MFLSFSFILQFFFVFHIFVIFQNFQIKQDNILHVDLISYQQDFLLKSMKKNSIYFLDFIFLFIFCYFSKEL